MVDFKRRNSKLTPTYPGINSYLIKIDSYDMPF